MDEGLGQKLAKARRNRRFLDRGDGRPQLVPVAHAAVHHVGARVGAAATIGGIGQSIAGTNAAWLAPPLLYSPRQLCLGVYPSNRRTFSVDHALPDPTMRPRSCTSGQ